jgi:TRAP-type transport system periplasmic protein
MEKEGTNMKNLLGILLMIILAGTLLLSSCASPAPSAALATAATSAAAPAPAQTTSAAKPTAAAAAAAVKTLRFASFDTPAGFASAGQQKWAEELEKRTGGQYKVEFSWGGAMGKMAEHYELVRSGTADIAYFLPHMTSGVFPMSNICALPWVYPNAKVSVEAMWQLYKKGYLDKEYSDVKPLFVWTGPGNQVFTTFPIATLADLKGKKIITNNEVLQKLVSSVGGVPMTTPLGEIYGALQRKIADGTFGIWVSVGPFKWYEVAAYTLEPAFGNIPCTVAMNKDTYNKLPDDVKKILTQLSEEILLPLTIKGYEDVTATSKEAFAKAGGKISQWSSADIASMSTIWKPLYDDWIATYSAKGLPAKEAANEEWAIVKSLGVDPPAIGFSVK